MRRGKETVSSHLERMKKFCLSHVPDANLALLARRDQEMVLTGVQEGSSPGFMTATCYMLKSLSLNILKG